MNTTGEIRPVQQPTPPAPVAEAKPIVQATTPVETKPLTVPVVAKAEQAMTQPGAEAPQPEVTPIPPTQALGEIVDEALHTPQGHNPDGALNALAHTPATEIRQRQQDDANRQ